VAVPRPHVDAASVAKMREDRKNHLTNLQRKREHAKARDL